MSTCCDTRLTCSALKGSCHQQQAPLQHDHVALIGNPNCGKSTLFNLLTGSRQQVGNWSGVTVERKSGYLLSEKSLIELIDLPGIYHLSTEQAAIDEQIAREFIFSEQAKVLVNVVSAPHLERHLYLSLQLIELGVPIILALNMMDIAKKQELHIDVAALSQTLGCPVLCLEAHKGGGIQQLRQLITQSIPAPTPTAAVQTALEAIRHSSSEVEKAQKRYQLIESLLSRVITQQAQNQSSWTERLDRVILNRFLGLPIFLGVMYLLFLFAINLGGAFQDFFDLSSQAIFVDGLAYSLYHLGVPDWLTALLANGIGKGINTTLTFIPVIGAMFLFLALLEDSGYMARAAFVVDRLMRVLGLPGKAFVPMIVGFGCNVPAVMAARSLDNQRDRILTIIMSPFMSCGARLAIYAAFVAVFFTQGGQNIVFALYLIGILMAVITGFILRHSLLKGEPAPLIMELPLYHAPRLHHIALHTWHRLSSFLYRAAKIIIPVCLLIGTLNAIHLDGSISFGEGSEHSLLAAGARWISPLFAPMGISPENWPATVGLATGILAKEVVIGTLNTLYSQIGHLEVSTQLTHYELWPALQAALLSIPHNLSELTSAFSNPILAQAPLQEVSEGIRGLMYAQFGSPASAFAYLLFVLLYFPCVSTMAVMLRELSRAWSIFSALWMGSLAYGSAVMVYQAATWSQHPLHASLWIGAIVTIWAGLIFSMHYCAKQHQSKKLRIDDSSLTLR